MTASSEPHRAILKAIPHLRAYAISLTGDMDRADDLVQETVTKALGHLHQFEPGTNMRFWLFAILRNQLHTQFRRRRWEIEDPDGIIAQQVTIPPAQIGHLDLQDLRSALGKLPAMYREALLLVSAEGMSYEEAAQVCSVSMGAFKTRVNRARTMLGRLMDGEDARGKGRGTTGTAASDGIPPT
jgi:RNA polymerase sigma-70 factor (ECF subfamily)